MSKMTITGFVLGMFSAVANAAPANLQQALYCKTGPAGSGSTGWPNNLVEALNYEIGQSGSLVAIKMRNEAGVVTTGQIRVGKVSAPSITIAAASGSALASVCVTIYADAGAAD